MTVGYDGTPFQGWQKQPHGPSVQSELERALTQLLSEPIRVIGSGRTDAGTHAVAQVAHFDSGKADIQIAKLWRGLNALLPDSVVVKSLVSAPDEFHAQRSAVRKTYIYRIWNHPVRSPLWRNRAYWIHRPLDLSRLARLTEPLIGTQDFKSFQTHGTVVKNTIRKVELAQFSSRNGPLIEFRITGSGFLKQMVRNIVGTLLYLESHQSEPTHLVEILRAKDRKAAKTTAPAHGLYLYKVEYPLNLDNKCRKP